MTTVYVAGASAEVERAERVMGWLRDAGLAIALDWTIPVRALGGQSLSEGKLRAEAESCLEAVQDSDVLLALIPPRGVHTQGMWAELGVAWASGIRTLASVTNHVPMFATVAEGITWTDESAVGVLAAWSRSGEALRRQYWGGWIECIRVHRVPKPSAADQRAVLEEWYAPIGETLADVVGWTKGTLWEPDD